MNRNMKYIPLHVHSHYSLQLGLSKPKDIAERCKELSINACAITDAGTIAGSVAFFKEMQNYDIKPILGCEIFICKDSANVKILMDGKILLRLYLYVMVLTFFIKNHA